MGRVDYNLTRQRLYGRYLYSRMAAMPVVGNGDVIASFRGGSISSTRAPRSATPTTSAPR